MDTITLPKKTYQSLLEKALRYERLSGIVQDKESIFAPPATKSITAIMKSLKSNGRYNPMFLKSLEK